MRLDLAAPLTDRAISTVHSQRLSTDQMCTVSNSKCRFNSEIDLPEAKGNLVQTNWSKPSAISHQPSARDAINSQITIQRRPKDGGRISLDRTMDPTKPALKPAFKIEIDGVDRSGVGVFHRCARVCFMHETKAHYWWRLRMYILAKIGIVFEETGNRKHRHRTIFDIFQSWGSSMLQPTLDSRISW